MVSRYASGKRALAICDRCGQTTYYRQLRELTIKQRKSNLLVCPTCWEPDQPQWMAGARPVFDPESLRRPRPDTDTGAGDTDSVTLPSIGVSHAHGDQDV
jgi:hypothetical protein